MAENNLPPSLLGSKDKKLAAATDEPRKARPSSLEPKSVFKSAWQLTESSLERITLARLEGAKAARRLGFPLTQPSYTLSRAKRIPFTLLGPLLQVNPNALQEWAAIGPNIEKAQ